jgi:hypothetical protein
MLKLNTFVSKSKGFFSKLMNALRKNDLRQSFPEAHRATLKVETACQAVTK